MLENLQVINKYILNLLNGLASNDIIERIVFIFADAPIFFLPFFLVISWIIATYSNKSQNEKNNIKNDLLYIFYGTFFGVAISLLIQQFVNIDRPELHLQNASNLLLSHIPDASFPSDHATVSFAFLAGLFLAGYKKIGYAFLPFVIIMNLSRIIAGVHWPFDILAGLLVGVTAAFFMFKYIKKNKCLSKLNMFVIKTMNLIKL